MRRVGERVDRYEICAVLGKGGMGEVYEAEDTRLGRRVALKLMQVGGDESMGQRMLREGRAAAAFEHPNAVTVFDVGEFEGTTYLAMELVRGKTLRDCVGEASIPLERRLRWLVDAARALGAAHRAGLVHRDVKPDNVMLRGDGVIKVLDFGIARRHATIDPSAPTAPLAMPTLTAEGVVVGTPLYSAPEQLRDEDLDGRADQFAWGVMAYELCTGAPPWRGGDGVSLLAQILSAEVKPVREITADVPEEVERVIAKTLAKRADERFATIDEAADALEPSAEAKSSSGVAGAAVSSMRPKTARESVTLRAARRTGRMFFWFAAGIGALVIGAIVVGAVRGKLRISFTGEPGKATGAAGAPVALLGCEAAVVEGDPTSDLGRALGIGGCARLATEAGVDWRDGAGPADASMLRVRLRPSPDKPTIALAVEHAGARIEAEGTGATPLDALNAAVTALAPKIPVAPPTEEDRVRWAAKDPDLGRRAERVWRRTVLNIAANHADEVRALVAADPESPFAHALLALVVLRGSAISDESRDRALELVSKLPPAREKGIKGILLVQRSKDDFREGMRLLRQAYADAPDDADIAGLYAAVAVDVVPEEGYSVVDRLVERFPTRSIVPLTNAIGQGDPSRDEGYVAKLNAIFPESVAWPSTVGHLLRAGKLAEARGALAFGKRLGLSGTSSDGTTLQRLGATVELADFQPRTAREAAQPLLSDPRPSVSSLGAALVVGSYVLEGRLDEADRMRRSQITRERDSGSPLVALTLMVADLRQSIRLGRPVPPGYVADFRKLVEERREIDGWSRIATLSLAAVAEGDKARARKELERLDALAESQGREGGASIESSRLAPLILVRFARGDAAAARLWKAGAHAHVDTRRVVAFDAAIALEAVGDRAEAERAYLAATVPDQLPYSAFEALAARVRLVALYEASGRKDDAARVETALARTWSDPALRRAVLAFR